MKDLLEDLFSRAAAYEIEGRRVDYIKLDMFTHKVEVKLTALPDSDYYDSILSQQHNTIQAARQDYAIWSKRHLGGLTVEDLNGRILLMLHSFLNTDFLRDDYYEISPSKRAKSKEELALLGMEKESATDVVIKRYALLRDMLDFRKGRFVFTNKDAIGNYMYDNRDTYSPARYAHYFRFITTLGLIYDDLDCMKNNNPDSDFEHCLTSMLHDLAPLREHVVPAFEANYDKMLHEILKVGNLQDKLTQVSPNTFRGGYNQKLACNLVGLFCGTSVYDVNPKQADGLIYVGKTHYTYINNYAAKDSSSELNNEDIKRIREIIRTYT